MVAIGDVPLASLGLADDECLISTSTERMQSLVNIAQSISSNENFKNVPSRTNILVINPKRYKKPRFDPIGASAVTVVIGGVPVSPTPEAVHLGILRSNSSSSKYQAIMVRISSHTRSLWCLTCWPGKEPQGLSSYIFEDPEHLPLPDSV